MQFLRNQITPQRTSANGVYPIESGEILNCDPIFPRPPEPPLPPDETVNPTQPPPQYTCNGSCITPSSEDPSTVEYYGYASSPSWCDCVGEGYVCNSTLVQTTEGPKLGYYCIEQQDLGCVQCLSQDNGCIYPASDPPCNAFNFIASRVFTNPYNYSVPVLITGAVDDDALLTYGSTQRWLRSGSPTTPSCEAGEVNYTFTIGANESFTIEAYDIYGVCGLVDICATFDPDNCNPP